MTYDENDVYNGPDTQRRGPFLFMAAMVGVILVAGGVAAASEVRADEVPAFTVSHEGVNLAPGRSFVDGDHVNIRATAPHHDLHMESKCRDRIDAECAGPLNDAAQFIGRSFIPWSAFGLTDGCVSWVQVAGINYHFPDFGESPICIGGSSSTPTPNPSTTPTSTPTSTPQQTSTPEPSSNPAPANTDSTTPTGESPFKQEASGLSRQAQSSAPARLADTGTDATVILILVAVFLLIGLLARIGAVQEQSRWTINTPKGK